MTQAAQMFADGEAYERLMGRWSRLVGESFLDWLAPETGLRWIDVGCGNGAFTEALVSRTAPSSVTGIDPSPGQIDYARRRPGAATAEFHVGDAEALPFPDRSFDAAVMALVIAFLPEPAKAVAEVLRVVRSGGCVAAYMWDMTAGGSPSAPVVIAARSLGLGSAGPPNPAASRIDTMQELWSAAGLLGVETRRFRIQVEHPDFDTYWAAASVPAGSVALIARLSVAERERLRERVREQVPMAADGRVVYEAVANAVRGRVPG